MFIDRPQFKYNLELIKSWVTTVWDGMKPFMISNAKVRRDMLTLLIEKMLGNLNNPLVTADFLMESMDTRMQYFFLYNIFNYKLRLLTCYNYYYYNFL